MNLDELRALPRPMAFVLPGGGALGAYQVGILRALVDAQVEPDLLVGVSAGAMNAALFAWNRGTEGLLRVEALWRTMRRRDLLRVNPGRMALAITGRRPSFLDSRHGESFLRQQLGARRIEDAPTRLAIIAANLGTGRSVVLDRGEVVTAIMASTAFPGVYPPVTIDGRTLIDGGVVADIPLDDAARLGARSAVVITVPPLAESPPPQHPLDILFRASTWGVEAHGRTMLARPPAGLTVVEVPAPPSSVTTFAVGDAGVIIDDAFATTQTWLTS